jgi:hypothetical protein
MVHRIDALPESSVSAQLAAGLLEGNRAKRALVVRRATFGPSNRALTGL